MREFLGLLLLLLVGFVTSSHATHSSAGVTIIMGKSDLDQAAIESFLRCLDGTGVDYRIYVAPGSEIVVIPAQQRWLDTTGIDFQLAQCMMKHYDQLSIMAESTVYPDKQHDTAVPHRQATYESLAGQGAKGQQPVGTKPTGAPRNETLGHRQSKRSLIMPRDTSHYFSYLDVHKDCASNDLYPSYGQKCHSFPSSYASSFFWKPHQQFMVAHVYMAASWLFSRQQ